MLFTLMVPGSRMTALESGACYLAESPIGTCSNALLFNLEHFQSCYCYLLLVLPVFPVVTRLPAAEQDGHKLDRTIVGLNIQPAMACQPQSSTTCTLYQSLRYMDATYSAILVVASTAVVRWIPPRCFQQAGRWTGVLPLGVGANRLFACDDGTTNTMS